jgi:hypothetical protein
MESAGIEKVPTKLPTAGGGRTGESARSYTVRGEERFYSVRLNNGTAIENVMIAKTER